MRDPLYSLPADLVLLVMKSSLDLPSLGSLIQASAVAAATFEQYYDKITEAVIISTLSTPLQRLVRTIITLRSDASVVKGQPESPAALDDFLNSYVYGDAGSRPLSKISAHLSVLVSFLRLASDIERLTQSFFETHLNRVNGITPSHLLNPSFHFSYQPLDDHPEGRPYRPAKCGPPSWVEHHRVYRALWRIQLYYDLAPSIESEEGPHRVWGRLTPWELDEIQCVYDHLQELQPPENDPSDSQPSLSLPNIKPPNTTQLWVAQPPPEDHDTAVAWRQDLEAADHVSPGYNFFHGPCVRMPSSPLEKSSFRAFRRLGFGIWDLQKMAGLEMLNLPKKMNAPANGQWYVMGVDRRLSLDDLFFTWMSVQGGELDDRSEAKTAVFVGPSTVEAAAG